LPYNWEHQGLIEPAAAIVILKKHGATHTVVSSVPSLDAALLWRGK